MTSQSNLIVCLLSQEVLKSAKAFAFLTNLPIFEDGTV